MPSRPLSAATSAAVKLGTKLDVEAIDVHKGRTDLRRPPGGTAQHRRDYLAVTTPVSVPLAICR